MRIAEGVFQLVATGGLKTAYPVLLQDKDSLVLVDTGYPGQLAEIAEAIREAGSNPEDLTDVILTHQDLDHVGGVNEVLGIAPFVRFWAHEEEAPYLDGQKTPVKLAGLLEHYGELTEEKRAWCDRLKEGFANRRLTALQLLKDGETLPFCGGVEIVHTPGHTPGHISLFLRESRIMVCGDAANIHDGKLVGANPEYTLDMPLAEQSFERILSFQPLGATCYHGGYREL